MERSIEEPVGDANNQERLRLCLQSLESNRYDAELFNDLFQAKVARTRVLAELDPALALIYFVHNSGIAFALGHLQSDEGLKEVVERYGKEDITTFSHYLHWYLQKDNQLYNEIVSVFEPIQEERVESSCATEEIKSPISESGRNGNGRIDLSSVQRRQYTAKDITNGSKLHHPSEDVKLATEYFVDEVLNNEIYDSGMRSRLASHLNRSGWYNKRMSDQQVLNFFGDLRIALAQGDNLDRQRVGGILDSASEDMTKKL